MLSQIIPCNKKQKKKYNDLPIFKYVICEPKKPKKKIENEKMDIKEDLKNSVYGNATAFNKTYPKYFFFKIPTGEEPNKYINTEESENKNYDVIDPKTITSLLNNNYIRKEKEMNINCLEQKIENSQKHIDLHNYCTIKYKAQNYEINERCNKLKVEDKKLKKLIKGHQGKIKQKNETYLESYNDNKKNEREIIKTVSDIYFMELDIEDYKGKIALLEMENERKANDLKELKKKIRDLQLYFLNNK